MNVTNEDLDFLRKYHPQIAIPCYGGQVFETVMMGLLKFAITANKIGMNFSVDTMVNESLISRGRNSLTAKMMANKDATHLMFIDADIGFEPEHIFKLLLHNKPIVGGLYPKKSPRIDYVINVDPANVNEQGQVKCIGDLMPVTRMGTGFMLISRDAIQKMFDSYPETKYTNNIGLDKKFDPFMYNLFDILISSDGFLQSEDYVLCDRWSALGGELWADFTIKLDHIGHYRYVGDPTRLSQILGTPQQAGFSLSPGDAASHKKSDTTLPTFGN